MQLEALKTHVEPVHRSVADKLNLLLARCTLLKNLAERRQVSVDAIDLRGVDEDAELASLFRKQREQDWAAPKRASQIEAEALYQRAQMQQPQHCASAVSASSKVASVKAAAASTKRAHAASSATRMVRSATLSAYDTASNALSRFSRVDGAGAGGEAAAGRGGSWAGEVVVKQGQLQLCFSKSNAAPHTQSWAKHWCVLTGSCLYLFSTPQQRSSLGR